ncbi:MAG: GIY-YIG nuclease family protein [Paludibacteraceae bacterium]|nr:GIY-YIG nuclease family protein [Paludibacteraceae bacterium]
MKNENKSGFVYLATNLVNGKKYVGITSKTIEKRWIAHKRASNLTNPSRCIFHKAIKKYGFENFLFEEIDHFDTEKEGQDKEINYISELKTFFPEGYNMTKGGEGISGHRFNQTEDTKLKISRAMSGVKKSESTRAKMKVAQQKIAPLKRGRVVSTETKRKISLGLSKSNKNYAFTQTKEFRKKISQSLKGKKQTKEAVERRTKTLIGKKRSIEFKIQCEERRRKLFEKRLAEMPENVFCSIKLKISLKESFGKIANFIYREYAYSIDKKTIEKRLEYFL